MKINTIPLLLIPFLLSSCFSNAIDFDIDTQSVRSGNIKSIRNLTIMEDSSETGYHIQWYGNNDNVPRTLSLSNIEQGYEVPSVPDACGTVENNMLKLKPSKKYIIQRSGGDAGSYAIYVWTDENGRVCDVSR